MIREQWYVVLESQELRKDPLGVIRMGERLVFWRDREGRAICNVDRCAHRGASLALGTVVCGGEALQCPFHGLEYDPSGACRLIPANGRAAPVPPEFHLPSYPTHEAEGFIWIYWGEGRPAGLPKYFDDLGPDFAWTTVQDPWSCGYSRAIENQLDMAHLPFVHHNTIGRGNRTVVDGPGLLHVEEGFFVYVYNRVDDGRPRRSTEEVAAPDPTRDYRLEFRFPNLWENRIADKIRIVAAFVPVDAERCILYLRYCHAFMKAPVLRHLMGFLGGRLNLLIAHQDRRVVETQLPREDGSAAGERLFPGDRAIMEYRKMRVAAKARAGKS